MSYHKIKDENSEETSFFERSVKIITKVFPSSLQYMLFYISYIVNLAFVGRLSNPVMLAALGVSSMMQHICVLSNVMGFNSAMDTLVSQAAGAKNLRLCGQYLNKARFLMTLLFIPFFFILINTESVLLYFNQNHEVAKIAQHYVLAYFPGLYIQGLVDGQQRFLNDFGFFNLTLYSHAIGLLLHPVWCYYFVIYKEHELLGIAYAMSITQIIIYSCLLHFTHT